MDKLDKDIEKIKLARMKPDDKFIYSILIKLKIELNSILDKTYYFHDNIHTYSYMKYYSDNENILYYNNSLFMSLLLDNNLKKYSKILINCDIEKKILSLTNKYFNMNFKYIEQY
jgi:hypothetical protein